MKKIIRQHAALLALLLVALQPSTDAVADDPPTIEMGTDEPVA